MFIRTHWFPWGRYRSSHKPKGVVALGDEPGMMQQDTWLGYGHHRAVSVIGHCDIIAICQLIPLPKYWKLLIITARKRSCGNVMFLHVSVILFIEGGSAIHPPGPPPPEGTGDQTGSDIIPPQKPQKRAVHILLECFLVVFLYVGHCALWVPPRYDVDRQFLHWH